MLFRSEGKGEERKLAFEFLAPDPTKRPKAKRSEDEEEDDEEPQAVLVDAAPRKALPSPKERKERPNRSPGGTVPNVPRRKDD